LPEPERVNIGLIRKTNRAHSRGWAILLLLGPVLAINLLFSVRYLSRLGMNTPVLVAVYMLGFAGALAAVLRTEEDTLQRRVPFVLLLGLVSIGSIVMFQVIGVHGLRVDRWHMIDTFWSNVADGRYAYTPRPNSNIPGPLPFYYVMALPFYLMGDIGYFTLAGLLGYAYLIWRFLGLGKSAYVALLTLILSMSFLWEVTTRSTIVVNMVVILGYLLWLDRSRPISERGLILAGVGGGLVLSTRSVVALPLLVYVVYAYVRQRHLKDIMLLGVAMLFGFSLTILPFYLWDRVGFSLYNPLLVQSALSTGPVLGIALVASLVLGWTSTSQRDAIAASGLVLFVAVLLSFIPATMQIGLATVVYGDYFDVSYFNLSMPFLAFALGQFTQPSTPRASA
jgi:hypothetical protein